MRKCRVSKVQRGQIESSNVEKNLCAFASLREIRRFSSFGQRPISLWLAAVQRG